MIDCSLFPANWCPIFVYFSRYLFLQDQSPVLLTHLSSEAVGCLLVNFSKIFAVISVARGLKKQDGRAKRNVQSWVSQRSRKRDSSKMGGSEDQRVRCAFRLGEGREVLRDFSLPLHERAFAFGAYFLGVQSRSESTSTPEWMKIYIWIECLEGKPGYKSKLIWIDNQWSVKTYGTTSIFHGKLGNKFLPGQIGPAFLLPLFQYPQAWP